VPGKFHKVPVSADITAVMGVRRPSAKGAGSAKKPLGKRASPVRSTRPSTPRSPLLRGR